MDNHLLELKTLIPQSAPDHLKTVCIAQRHPYVVYYKGTKKAPAHSSFPVRNAPRPGGDQELSDGESGLQVRTQGLVSKHHEREKKRTTY